MTGTPVRTTAQEVCQRYNASATAAKRFRDWQNWPQASRVVRPVMKHVSQRVYDVTPAAVETVCRRIAADGDQHALGNVDKRSIAAVDLATNWHPSFAFTHVCNFVVEAEGRLPAWQEFLELLQSEPYRGLLWDEYVEVRSKIAVRHASAALAEQAMQWRLGNFYYSWLREHYVVARLRDAGLDARVHPLADALYRVDCWVGDVNVCLFVRNPAFRSGDGASAQGRKLVPERDFGDHPTAKWLTVELEVEHHFGVVHLPSEAAVAGTVRAIRRHEPA